MNGTATDVLDSKAISKRSVRFRTRCMAYIAVWLVAAIMFWVLVGPDSAVETSLTPTQQFIRLPIGLPILAWIGVARAVGGPGSPGRAAYPEVISLAWLIFVCIFSLTRRHLGSLLCMICLHAATLGLAYMFLLHWWTEMGSP
jgi:hypothetical protein